jgi:hypothetical protein
MKPMYKIAIVIVPLLVSTVVPEAHARRGRGAAFAVGVAAGSAKSHSPESSSAQAEAAPAQQQAAPAQQQAAAAQQPAAAAGKPLPPGTVVAALPQGCAKTAVGGMDYYHCGGNYYQPVYEGSTLKYVTAKPK